MLDPFQHGVQRHLLQHEAAATARVVQLAQVPLAEEIVRPLVHRVIEIVGPGIDGQFFEQRGVEHRFELHGGIDAFEDRQGTRNQVVIAAHGHTRPADEQRNRPHPLMGIRLDLLLRAEHGHRPMTQVIVQLGDRAVDDAIGFVPWPALLQHGFADPANEQRLKQAFLPTGGIADRRGTGDSRAASSRRPIPARPPPDRSGERPRRGRADRASVVARKRCIALQVGSTRSGQASITSKRRLMFRKNRGSAAPDEKLRYPRISCPVLVASVPWPICSMQNLRRSITAATTQFVLLNCRKSRQNVLGPPLVGILRDFFCVT